MGIHVPAPPSLVQVGGLGAGTQDPLMFLMQAGCVTLRKPFDPRPWYTSPAQGGGSRGSKFAKCPPTCKALWMIVLPSRRHWEDLLREQMWKHLEESSTAQ